MKVLYISIKNDSFATGGIICRQNNRKALQKNDRIQLSEYFIPLKNSKISKILSVLFGYKCGMSLSHIREILKRIVEERIDVVFLDTSLYGLLVKAIYKKTDTKIITFFHNCEYEIYRQSIKHKFISIPLLHSVYINEYYSLNYSNKCVFLTERDNDDCKKRYKLNAKAFYAPIALDNKYSFSPKKILLKKPKKLLFVGSYFYPNIHGLSWFINFVLPYINYELTVIGKGFETEDFLNKISFKERLVIKGYVESLDAEYEATDIVIQPVFKGSGMKTKTAECFMYGKPLVSSSEGLVGYLKELNFVYECNTSEDFIKVLQDLSNKELPNFCDNLRKCFETVYSLDARTELYKKLLEEIENE